MFVVCESSKHIVHNIFSFVKMKCFLHRWKKSMWVEENKINQYNIIISHSNPSQI